MRQLSRNLSVLSMGLALMASGPLALAKHKAAGCSCDESCQAACKEGKSDQCDCKDKDCGCKTGKCKHGKCSHEPHAKKDAEPKHD